MPHQSPIPPAPVARCVPAFAAVCFAVCMGLIGFAPAVAMAQDSPDTGETPATPAADAGDAAEPDFGLGVDLPSDAGTVGEEVLGTADGTSDGLEPAKPRATDTWSQWLNAGREHWPRVTYLSPPFDGDDYWLPGGIFRVENPQLFLMPVRLAFVWDLSGDLGYDANVRIWGDSLLSWGVEFWALLNHNDYGDTWRLITDLSFFTWPGTKAAFEFGGLIGAERDTLLSSRSQSPEVGFLVGATARLTVWRFEFRADWVARVDTKHVFGYGDLRHSMRLMANFEAIRIDRLGLDVGFWFNAVQGGTPRVGLQIGLRFWFSADRDQPEFVTRYGTLRD